MCIRDRCSATDTYDIAMAADGVDICAEIFDGDPMDGDCQEKLDFSKTLAFKNFKLMKNPFDTEFSSIDNNARKVNPTNDYFTLFDFSAKWDPVPTMLTQNHTQMCIRDRSMIGDEQVLIVLLFIA